MWQPIKTAPKDGTVIDLSVLITFPKGNTDRMRWTECYWAEECGAWQNMGDADPEQGWEQDDGPRVCKVTHWMPIPENP